MDQLRDDFDPINIQVALACDGNRRKELNTIKRSKGFNWGSGAVSCAYWKGPLLRDVLLAAGIPENLPEGHRYWVNFAGADEPSEGTYETCIPFQYAMDPKNDVILAQFMNDEPLPPDHGAPIRVIIPGYVGGRCVKWLKRIWISDKENESYYHIWDNRVLPSFITEKDGEFATAMFTHPSTACSEQNLNSVIVKPAQGEKVSPPEARKGKTFRVEGYAYDGGGHEVQRVEVSLDGGETWLYCIRTFPEAPIRHGNKFWIWLHWHVDVEIAHLLRCKNLSVRCWNVFKNTQPEHPNWNTMVRLYQPDKTHAASILILTKIFVGNDEQLLVHCRARGNRRQERWSAGDYLQASLRAWDWKSRLDEAIYRAADHRCQTIWKYAGKAIHKRGDREA